MAQAVNLPVNPQEMDQQQTTKNKKVRFQQPMVLENKCVCQLCTCGRHRCPKPNIKAIYETTYKDHYRLFKTPKYSLSAIVDHTAPEQSHYNPADLISNYRADYVKQDLEKAQNRSLIIETPTKRSIKFTGQSEYNLKYQGHLRVKTEASPPRTNEGTVLPQSAVFIGSSNYTDSYQIKDMLPAKPIKQTYQLLPPIKFQGSSSYQQDYIAFPMKSLNINVKNLYEQPRVSLPFRGESTYKHNFAKPALTPLSRNQQPAQTVKKDCICELLSIPKTNPSEHHHLRFVKGQWV